jgi:phosphopantothenoylcysteine decarboxylase/phosphopantothenate--cysteine ligase
MEPIVLLQNKRIVLGICGGIAAYKAADLASKLTQAGAQVDCILTESAARFVTPLTFASVTGRKAFTDADLWDTLAHVPHIGLGTQADLVVIAPATANTLAKLAQGLADNLITVTALAARCPVMVVPAMDAGMWEHPATQANIATLRERRERAIIVGPERGRMASGLIGLGRMTEPGDILGHIRLALGRNGSLAGRRIVVTAGGTQEPLDPVRYVGNRSSGKQGLALAQAALDQGASVTLIAGATAGLPSPIGATRVDVMTAAQMQDAVLEACHDVDALVMAAAVADFRPAQIADQKIKKTVDTTELALTLERTPDVLAAVHAAKNALPRLRVVVGFAAETQDLLANAQKKLVAKGLDLIVANDVSAPDAGFSVDTNRVTILDRGGRAEALPLMSKAAVAEAIVERVAILLASSGLPSAVSGQKDK